MRISDDIIWPVSTVGICSSVKLFVYPHTKNLLFVLCCWGIVLFLVLSEYFMSASGPPPPLCYRTTYVSIIFQCIPYLFLPLCCMYTASDSKKTKWNMIQYDHCPSELDPLQGGKPSIFSRNLYNSWQRLFTTTTNLWVKCVSNSSNRWSVRWKYHQRGSHGHS